MTPPSTPASTISAPSARPAAPTTVRAWWRSWAATAGDIALKAAAGSGAEICLVPEVSWSIQEAADRLSRLIDMGNPRATVVVAEGAWDSMQPADWRRYLIESGVKGIHEDDPINTEKLALLLKHKCKCEARPTVLGYTQRGRTPSAYDSWFAFEAGNLAVNLLRNGIGNQVIGIKDGRVSLPAHRRSPQAEA